MAGPAPTLTQHRKLPKYQQSNDPDGPTQTGALADRLEATMLEVAESTAASRPAPGAPRRVHRATDTGDVLLDVGSRWLPLTIPVGGAILWPSDQDPGTPDWLVGRGQAVSRSDYARLFELYGTLWGAGNGSTTFNLPPTGVFPWLTDATADGQRAVGVRGGAESVALTAAQNGQHAHGVSDPGHGHSVSNYLNGGGNNGQPYVGVGYNSATGGPVTGYANASGTGVSIQNSGSGQAHPNMPPFMTVQFLIRAR